MNKNNKNAARIDVKQPYLCMMGLFLGAFTGMFGETALNIAIAPLSVIFKVDVSLMQWMVVGHVLVIGLVLPFASILLKHFPAKKLTLFALGVFLIGSMMCALAPNFAILLTGRLIQGIGPGLLLPIMFAVVLEIFPPNKIGTAMGTSAMIVMFAPAIGPTLTGLILAQLSFRWLFFFFAFVLLIAFLFAAKYMVSPYKLTKPKINALSSITSIFGFSGIVLAFGLASSFEWGSIQVLIPLIVGIFSLIFFIYRQLNTENPMLNLRAFKCRNFSIGTTLVMLAFGITLSSMYILPQFLQISLVLSVALTGFVVMPGGIANALGSLVAGRLYDKFGAKLLVISGFVLTCIGIFLLLIANENSSVGYIILSSVILMSGVPLSMAPSQTIGLHSLPANLSTDGSTILNTLQQVWGAICTAVATSLLGIGQLAYINGGGTDAKSAFTIGTNYGFMFTLTLAALGLILAFTLPKKDIFLSKKEETGKFSLLPSIMKIDVYTANEENSIMTALKYIVKMKISGVPIVNSNKQPTGFISDGDIMRFLSNAIPMPISIYALTADDRNLDEKISQLMQYKVKDIMKRKLISVDINDSMEEVCSVLGENHFKKVPVMENGKMIGIVNNSNITKYILKTVHWGQA